MKFKSFILLPAMMLILASCGPKEDSSSSTSPSSSSTSESTTTSQPVEVKYGSLEAPLKVDEFVTEAGKLKLGHQEFSKKSFFVEGYVDSSMVWNEGFGNFNKFKLATAKGSETMIEVSGAKRGEGVSDVYHNDTIVLEGLAEVYNDVLCIYFDKTNNNYPTIHKVTVGESMIKVTAEHASVTGLMEKYTNGAMSEFTVLVDAGFKVNSVTAYGKELSEKEGKYTFKVMGDGEVKVLTSEASSKDIVVTTPIAATSFKTVEGTTTAAFTDKEVEFILDKNESTSDFRLSDSDHLRVYAKAKFTVKVKGTISKIIYTCTSTSYAADLKASAFSGGSVDASSSDADVMVNATSGEVSFTGAKQVRISQVVVTYVPAE